MGANIEHSRLDRFGKILSVAKDALIISVILALGWRYIPLLFDPSLTSDFEISEINLFVVKLTPQESERALAAPNAQDILNQVDDVDASESDDEDEAGDMLAAQADEHDDSTTSRSEQPSTQPANKARAIPQQRIEKQTVTYMSQSQGQHARQILLPVENIVRNEDEANINIKGWSYVGTFRNGAYIDLTFDIGESKNPNDLVDQSITAVTDVFIRDDKPRFVLGWTKGERVGVIKKGRAVKVESVALIPAKGGGNRVWVRT